MSTSETVSILISVAALIVSFLSFWWKDLRRTRRLLLVRLDDMSRPMEIQVALVNAGTHDVLVSSIKVFLEGATEGSRFYPGMRISTTPDSAAIVAGKAVQIRAEFVETFTQSLASEGLKVAPWQHLSTHYVYVEIDWVDDGGSVRQARVPVYRLGLEPDGKFRAWRKYQDSSAPIDLNAAAVTRQLDRSLV